MQKKTYYLQFKLFNHITKFPFKYLGDNSEINKIRTHYFFSTKRDIDKTLKNILIDIRITNTEHWDNISFAGKSMSLYEFIHNYNPLNTILLAKCISLFSTDISEHMSLHVLVVVEYRQI